MDIQNQQSQHNNDALYAEIAERERTEAALHTSEARFQAVFQGSSTTVFTHDRELRYTWMYPAYSKEQWILGKTDLELAQADNYPHLTPQEAHLLTDLKQHALDSGQGSRQKISLTYGGHSKWYDLKIEPLRDEDGSIAGLTCVATDITEYQRTLEQQHLLSEITKRLSLGVSTITRMRLLAELLVSRLGDICSVDVLKEHNQVESLLVVTRNSEQSPVVPLDASGWSNQHSVMQVLQTGEIVFVGAVADEHVRDNANQESPLTQLRVPGVRSYIGVPLVRQMQTVGVLSLLRVDTSPYFDTEDAELLAEIGRRTALALDNVYLYEAERQARDAAELAADRTARLQRITAALAEGLSFDEVTEVIVDQGITALGAFAGSVALLDDHAERLEVVRARGYSDTWLNRWQIVNANAPVPMVTVIQQRAPLWIESREEFTARYPHISLNEIDSRSSAWAILPLKLADQVIGALGMSFAEARTFNTEEQNFMLALAQQCSQAFERARLYQAERAARAEAETAVQIRDQVFRIISHDLRSPLTAIRGQAHLLSRRLPDVAEESRERFQRGLNNIVLATDRMSTQIQELLDVASLQANKPLSLNWGAIELVELVQRVVEAVQDTTDIHQISLHAPEESLPSIGDEMRLERVLTNLITNAVKYSPEGGNVRVTLAREVQPEGLAGVVLTVQDQGIGIPADELPLLFRPFYRARNVSIHIPGTGLGLASARQIIQQHQGELHVESEEGQGSTFIIHLPLEE